MNQARFQYSPSSSPPSSPGCIDSSPPSSPGFDPVAIDSTPTSLNLAHPFAASAKATRSPPQYEKKKRPALESPSIVSASPSKRARYVHRKVDSQDLGDPREELDMLNLCPDPIMVPTRSEREMLVWDEASTRVIDDVNGTVELDGSNLTHIPKKFIDDLNKFYVPPLSIEAVNAGRVQAFTQSQVVPGGRLFTRVVTAPAGDADLFPRMFAERTRTFVNVSVGRPREEIRLFLSSNEIAALPLEMMNLERLTVLSIRNNLLTYIPPEIRNLKNLHTLNIANNKIKYLPAEMLTMTLTSLQVHPNPFLEPPSATAEARPASSPLLLPPRIPSLVELCLRVLFSPPPTRLPASADEGQLCLLEAHYETPLFEYLPNLYDPPPPPGKQRFCHRIPPHIRGILDACVPGSVYTELEADEHYPDPFGKTLCPSRGADNSDNTVTSIGKCPSPWHEQSGKTGVFARHKEERYTWEGTIAGCQVGGFVPVKWRGCSWGCLNFLDPPNREIVPEGAEETEHTVVVEGPLPSDAIQVLQFESGGFQDEDFSDE